MNLGTSMGRENWQAIHREISTRIVEGRMRPGERLPTEPELCSMFGAGRHSIRRAIEALSIEGKLRVEQGRGTFVEDAPLIEYHIGQRVRFRQNLRQQGVVPGGAVIEAITCPAPRSVAKALDLAPETTVHRLCSRGEADGVPISIGYSYHEAARFPELPAMRRAGVSITEIYRHYGIDDYFRHSTTILSRRAEPEESALLHQHPAQPVLVVRKTDVDAARRPLAHSEGIWAADRVRFTFEDQSEDSSAAD